MNRRRFLGATAAGAVAQFGSDEGDGSDEDAGSYQDLDGDQFPSEVSIGWIDERFIQIRSADSPVVGHQVDATAFALEVVSSVEEHERLVSGFDWNDLDMTGSDAFETLFETVAWPLESSLDGAFFDDYHLVWLGGTHADYYRSSSIGEGSVPTDLRFYDIYDHAPFVFGVVERGRSPDAGTVVQLSATVEHADGDHGYDAIAGGGAFLTVDDVSVAEDLRTDPSGWRAGTEVGFTGLQHHPRPRLSSVLTDVDYEDDLPRPKGGSIVRKVGEATAGEADRLGLSSRSQDVLVGETLPESWDEEESNDDESEEGTTELANISIVIDTSGSMDGRDTNVEDDQGNPLMRIDVAKRSLKALVDFVENGHRASIVEFDDDASLVAGLTEIDDRSREDLKGRVEDLFPDGGTSIGGGMRRGMETIVDEPGPKTMVVLSDGIENEPPYVDEVLPELRNQGIEVYTIGMGQEIDRNQLERIANETGGDSAMAPNPSEVRQLYQQFSSSAQQRPILTGDEEVVAEGDRLANTVNVDSSCDDVQFSLSYPGSEMSLTVTDPAGNEISEGPDVRHHVGDTHEVWTVEDPSTGEWNYEVEVVQVDAPQEATVQASAQSPIDGELFVSDDLYEQSGYYRLQLKLTEGVERYTGGDVRIEALEPGAEWPDGTETETEAGVAGGNDGTETDAAPIEEIVVSDDGSGPDAVPEDGIYTGYFHPEESGEYEFRAAVEGGEYANLGREFTESVSVDSVVDEPVKPYEERRLGSGGGGGGSRSSGDDGSFLSSLPLIPAALGTIVLGLIGAAVGALYVRGDDDDPDAAPSPTTESDDAAGDAEPDSEVDGPDEGGDSEPVDGEAADGAEEGEPDENEPVDDAPADAPAEDGRNDPEDDADE